MRTAVIISLLFVAACLCGCAIVNVKVTTTTDGAKVVEASGFSLFKEHGLEGLTFEKSAKATKFQLSGYSSKTTLADTLRAMAEAVEKAK